MVFSRFRHTLTAHFYTRSRRCLLDDLIPPDLSLYDNQLAHVLFLSNQKKPIRSKERCALLAFALSRRMNSHR